MFYYQGELTRVRLINRFPKEVLNKLAPGSEWAAQMLLISRWFTEVTHPTYVKDCDWMKCCDVDSDPSDPNIFIEVVVGGYGPVTLKSPTSKDIFAGNLILANDYKISYNLEHSSRNFLYECEDIFTKQVKNCNYLRRHKHIEKGGRLLWNLKAKQFIKELENPTNNVTPNYEILEALTQVKDELFVVTP